MDLKWEKTSMFRLFSWEMLHSCCFWLNALIIHLKLSKGFWAGWYICKTGHWLLLLSKRSKTAWKSKILEERFENVVNWKIKQFGVGRLSNSRPLPHGETWKAGKTRTKLANRTKSIKHIVLKRSNYLTISEEPIEVQIGKMNEV